MSELFGVWTPAVVAAAVLAGLGVGFFGAGPIIRSPYFSSGQATPFANGVMIAAVAAVSGIAFYVGQVFGAIAGGDDLWPRILSRFTLWLVYALFLGVGAWLSATRDEHNRHARARARALREIGRQS